MVEKVHRWRKLTQRVLLRESMGTDRGLQAIRSSPRLREAVQRAVDFLIPIMDISMGRRTARILRTSVASAYFRS